MYNASEGDDYVWLETAFETQEKSGVQNPYPASICFYCTLYYDRWRDLVPQKVSVVESAVSVSVKETVNGCSPKEKRTSEMA